MTTANGSTRVVKLPKSRKAINVGDFDAIRLAREQRANRIVGKVLEVADGCFYECLGYDKDGRLMLCRDERDSLDSISLADSVKWRAEMSRAYERGFVSSVSNDLPAEAKWFEQVHFALMIAEEKARLKAKRSKGK